MHYTTFAPIYSLKESTLVVKSQNQSADFVQFENFIVNDGHRLHTINLSSLRISIIFTCRDF